MSDKDQVTDQDVELEDENEVEEAHDPKNAEMDSYKSVEKSDDSVKQAPARKGDKRSSEKMKSNKSMMVNAIYKELMKQPQDNIATAYKNMFGEDFELSEDEDAESVNAKEELESLVDEEATLSEEFKDKATTLFETALAARIAEEVESLEETYAERLEEEVTEIQNELVEKVDGYLNYVVENWMEENKLAVQSGLRSEIAEDFMKGLHTLFKESYVDVPEGKEDLVDDLANRVDELEEKLNETTSDAIDLAEEVESLYREKIVLEASRDLADTQAEKLGKLAEGLDFQDPESFAEKVDMVKESYFPSESNSNQNLDEDFDDNEDDGSTGTTNPMMESYLSALKRTNKK